MRTMLRALLVTLLLAAGVAAGGAWYARHTGLSARVRPGAFETLVAGAIRRISVPTEVRNRRNPVSPTADVIAAGRAHFADHCASCHGNDGGGDTEMGRNLYPKAPDMRRPGTQNLTDGELFWIIENGIRFTGMPGWSTGTAEGEEASWHLVHFIRHLPDIGEAEIAEMEALNPRSPEETRQEIAAEQFLRGDDPPPAGPGHAH